MFWKTSTYFSLILTRVVGYNSKKKKKWRTCYLQICVIVCVYVIGGDCLESESMVAMMMAMRRRKWVSSHVSVWKERGGVGERGKRGNTLPPLGKRGWQSILDDSGHKGWRWKLVKLSLPRFGKHSLSDTPINQNQPYASTSMQNGQSHSQIRFCSQDGPGLHCVSHFSM